MLNEKELQQVYDYILTHGRKIESLGKLPQDFPMDNLVAFPAVHLGDGTEYASLLVPMERAKDWMTVQANTAAKAAAAAVAAEEAAARQDADNALSERIDEEATTRADKDEELRNLVNVEVTARIGADTELLNRIKGASNASNAYTDPFRYIGNFTPSYDDTGNLEENAIQRFQSSLLNLLRNNNYRDSFPYIGHLKAFIEGVPIEAWNYVKTWNQGSTSGVFVQVVRTNYALSSAGVISSAATSEFHEYHREVTVAMSNGLVTDVTATPWKESTVTAEQTKNLSIITNLGHYSTRDALLAAAAKINIIQLSSDNSVRILFGTYTEGSTNSVLILQHNTRTGSVSGSGNGTTMQYVFDGKQRYTRYIDHNASSVTSVQSLQPEGVRNLYFTPKGFIGLRDMWGTQVGSGFFLPNNTAIREDAANTTATSVGLIITSFLGTTKTATLGAVTSARAGLMTVALYNELKQATAGVAEEEEARISLGDHIAADIQSISEAVATVQTNESNHYTEMQNHLSVIYKRLAAAETKLSDLETRVQTIEAHLNLRADGDFEEL